MKLKTGTSGYLEVDLRKNGTHKYCRIHRLVAQAFIPNPNNYPCVNHKDENKRNNLLENLEWCTNKYNSNYGNAIEKTQQKRRKRVVQIDKTSNKIVNIFNSLTEAEEHTGILQGHISSCCTGKRKTTGGYKWRYQMKYIISNSIRIQNPTDEMKNYVEENLVIPNPDYIRNERLGYSNWKTPRFLVWYEIEENDIIVPFGFLNWLWKFDSDIKNYDNRIVLGEKLQYKSKIKLFDYQERVVEKAIQKKNGRNYNASWKWKDTDSLRTNSKIRVKNTMDYPYN